MGRSSLVSWKLEVSALNLAGRYQRYKRPVSRWTRSFTGKLFATINVKQETIHALAPYIFTNCLYFLDRVKPRMQIRKCEETHFDFAACKLFVIYTLLISLEEGLILHCSYLGLFHTEPKRT